MATFVRRSATAPSASFGTGVGGFDSAFLGASGGVPAGALMALHEETQRRSAGVSLSILRCFAAEGLVTNQRLLIVAARDEGADGPLGSLVYLPAVRGAGSSAKPAEGESMRIAWRYASMPAATSAEHASRRAYDLRSRMDLAGYAGSVHLLAIDFSSGEWLSSLSATVLRAVEEAKQATAALRIVLPSVGGCGWPHDCVAPALHAVRSAIRTSPCSAVATLVAHLLPQDVLSTAHSLCDGVVSANALPEPPAGVQRAEYAAAALRALVPVRGPGVLVGSVPPSDMAAVRASAGRVLRVEPLYIPPEDAVASPSCSSPSLEF